MDLPLTKPETAVTDPHPRRDRVPRQREGFDRPAVEDIDFEAVIRRADRSRIARRIAWTSAGLTGLALIAFLLTSAPAVAVLAAVCAVTAVASSITRIRMERAPVPRIQR